MNWVPGQKIHDGKYEIVKTLGRGAFGITYQAWHTRLKQGVVIKTPDELLKRDPDYPKYIKRFIQEAEILAQLCREPHPHIVRVSDFFAERNTHCLVMDYIPGESLGEMIRDRETLPETEAVEYIRQVGSALKVVHEEGLVHLDVTPSNIMLRSSGNAVLIDFGIAGDMSPPSSFSRSFGNKAFAPYELFEGVRHPTVDVYTLAASLYYAVTGERPAKSFDRKYHSKKTKFVSPKELVPQISDEVNRAILSGMELEPENRPQSMQEWLDLFDVPVNAPKLPMNGAQGYMNWAQGQQLQNGQYVIEKVLGIGGFGITYKARHMVLNYDVVIKTPNKNVKFDPDYAEYVDQFIKEGRMLAQLSNEPHPHIVRISDLFQEGDTHCLVMDFIQGESLWHLVGRRGALSETEAVEYIRQIGSALSVVHQKHLVHLDVTPHNIMVRNTGKAVLIDFGIAADMSPPSSFSRSFGNWRFAPYELLSKASRHPTVDIYCLAASLYYAVTGQCPTKSFDRKYDGVELKAPKRLVPQISDEVNQTILKGMELEPEDRPQSMQQWLKLLERKQVAQVETPQPVQPSPQRSGLRNGSSVPRRRLNAKSTFVVGAVVALTLVASAGALVGWQYPLLNLPINLNSEVGVNYSKLQNLLAQDKWKEADEETRNVMLKVAGREKDGWLRVEDLEKFPCTDLRTIDTLWVKYSKGRFGFSVQKRIWKSVGGTPDADDETYLRFSARIKWRVNNDWLDYNSLTFSVEKAPEGHLPGWYGGKYGWWGGLFSGMETCRV